MPQDRIEATRANISSIPYYDHFADQYAARRREVSYGSVLEEFAGLLPAPSRVLDAGCGPGFELAWLLDRGFEVEGLDGSAEMVRIARERAPRARVVQKDLLFFSPEPQSYDGVWANRSLIHLPPNGVLRVLQQFFKALRRGGVLFASIETGEGSYEDSTDRRDAAEGPTRLIHRYPHEEFSSLLRQCGLTLEIECQEKDRPWRRGYLARRRI